MCHASRAVQAPRWAQKDTWTGNVDWARLTVPIWLGPKFAAFFPVSVITDC